MGLSNSVHLMRGGDEASDGGGAVTNAIKSTKSAGSDAVTINIRRSNATKFAVQVSLESSIESFKSEIAKTINVPVEQQFLVYKGWLLKDDRTLKTYGMEAEHTVHILGGILPVESNNPTNTVADKTDDMISGLEELSISDDPSSSTITSVIFQQILQSLFKNRNLLPETIYQLMINPEAMRIRIFNSPELREIIDPLPDFAAIVHSPDIFHHLAQAVLYFEFIREMKRYRENGGGGGGAAPVCLRGHETKDQEGNKQPEGMLDSAPDFDLICGILGNPTIMTIQNLLMNPPNSNRILNPQVTELMQETSLYVHLEDLETMQQLMALTQWYFF